MTNATDRAPIALDYAPGRGRSWRRWVLRIALVVGFAVLTLAGWRWGPGICSRITLLCWQRACLNYDAPPEQVVCEAEPTQARALLGRPGKEYVDFWTQPEFGPSWAALKPKVIGGPPSPVAVRVAPCWEQLVSRLGPLLSPRDYTRGATIFLNERYTPSGQRRLVVVQYLPLDDEGFEFWTGYDATHTVITPGTLLHNPEDVTSRPGLAISRMVQEWHPHLRIYAGQADPADRSHFTIRYEAWGQCDTLDGRLNDDGTVSLEARNRPQQAP